MVVKSLTMKEGGGALLYDLLKRCLVTLLVVQLALPLSLRAEGVREPEFVAQPEREEGQLPAGMAEIIADLEQADEHTPVRDVPDPFHLTQQYLVVMRGDGNSSDRYHLAGTEGGLPRIPPQPNKVQAANFNGKLALRYRHAVHVIESITPALIAYDRELLVVIATDGVVYALDMTFARRELFKAPLPVHKLPLLIESEDLSGMQAGFITRGFNLLTHALTEQDTVQPLSTAKRFAAGDLVLWREHEQKRVLISAVERDFIVTAINNGNYLLASLAYATRTDSPLALRVALDQEKQHRRDKQLAAQETASEEAAQVLAAQETASEEAAQVLAAQETASEEAAQVLQNMNVKRLQAMLLDDVEMNNYRDSFTYAHWQCDYLLLQKQAEVTIKNLKNKFIKDPTTKKQIATLEQQLRSGDLGGSWIMLSKLYVEETRDLLIDRINALQQVDTPEAQAKITELEAIVASKDFQRIWHEPHLLADTGTASLSPFRQRVRREVYKHLNGESLQHIASTILGLGVLGAAGWGAARALKTGFSLKRLLYPDPLRTKDLAVGGAASKSAYVSAIKTNYRRYALIATGLGIALIPTVALLGWLSARGSGEDWDFRKQLTLIGIRTYATLALPLWHYLANITGQKTLMPSLAARVSPFTTVNGSSPLGESVGLAPGEAVRVGVQVPFMQDNDDEALRRRAISALQRQQARAQALGWEMAARAIWQEWAKGQQLDDITYHDLVNTVQQSGFQQRWKRMAVGLEAEIAKLQREGVFPDLRTTTYERVHGFIAKTKPHLLDSAYHDSRLRSAGHTLRRWGSNTTRAFATVATDNVDFLRVVDPDDFIATTVWRSFMIDFFTVVFYEPMLGVRARTFGNVDDLQKLAATNKFPFWHLEHRFTVIDQIYVYQISVQGRLSLLFQMLEKVKESNYSPLEEVLLVGKDNPQGFAAGLLDLGGSSLDLRNVDYGSRYVRNLWITGTMMQAALLWTIVGRGLIAKVAIGGLLPQFLFNTFWAMWGFSWPWIAYYSSEHLRDKKHTIRLGMLMQAKVQLRTSIDRNDAAGMQRGYQALLAVYRDFEVALPTTLVREVKQVEDDLGIAAAQRLTSTELMPYFATLTQMAESDDRVEKRNIYRNIIAHIESEQQPETLSREDAERVLNFVMLNPPFPTSLNETVSRLGVLGGAIVTTVMGSRFFLRSFDKNSIKGVLPYVIGGAGIYTAVWLLLEKQRARKIWNFIREDMLGYPPDRAKEY